jgi:hypothetical protein
MASLLITSRVVSEVIDFQWRMTPEKKLDFVGFCVHSSGLDTALTPTQVPSGRWRRNYHIPAPTLAEPGNLFAVILLIHERTFDGLR